MYELICLSDFTDDTSMQKKMKKAFIKNIQVLPINLRSSIKDSSNITIHNNLTTLYIRLLYLNYQYRNENFYIVIVPNIDTPLDTVLIPKEFTDQPILFG